MGDDYTYGGPGGATGNGTTDDTNAIQSCLDAANSADPKKGVYFPAGTYLVGAALAPPSGVDMRGVGNTSIIYRADPGSQTSFGVIDFLSKSNITVSYLRVKSDMATYASASTMLNIGGSSGITLDHLTIDTCFYAIEIYDYNATDCANITVSNCTVSNCVFPTHVVHASNVLFSHCDIDQLTDTELAWPGGAEGRIPHHLYIDHTVDGFRAEHCTLRDGYSWAVQIYPGALNDIVLYDVTLSNVSRGIIVAGDNITNVTLDNIHGLSIRQEGDAWVCVQSGVTGCTLQNSDFDDMGLLLTEGAESSVICKDNTLTNCTRFFDEDEPGCYTSSGVVPTYSGNVVTE